MGNVCMPNIQNWLCPPFMHKQIVKIIKAKRNLFQQIIIPYQGTQLRQWVKVDEIFMYAGQRQGYNKHGRGLLYNRQQDYLVIGFFFENHLVGYHCKKIYSDRKQYVGQLNSMCEQHGIGRLKTQQYVYEGQFKNGKFQNRGTLIRENEKIKFTGIFQRGEKKYGIQQTSEEIYEGNFENNIRVGQGSLTKKEYQIRYQGNFVNNCLQGPVRAYFSKDQYIGTYNFVSGVLIQ